ncbi:amidohydrolase [Parashewanella curva]|uniref:Amidohydrolase n=1 Tax=Parashewanella curva TaxID=2338552 RepID=A0A3L8PVC4_9GAMM|nr:amidohydrolase family protein [Parashewanella curva]RLV58719.1 amidohydrolase [Parashewanella curva]
MKKHLLTISLLSVASMISAAAFASDIVPAATQKQAVLLQNATIHTAANGVIENGDMLFNNGRIVEIGQDLNSNSAKIIDLTGKHVYPGLVALSTSLGLVEVNAVKESVDNREVGFVNPQLSPAVAYNADSEIIPTVRRNGITYAQVIPTGNGIAGQSIVVNLDAWNIDDALVKTGPQMNLYWPSIRWASSDPTVYKKQLESLNKQINEVHQAFENGYRYYLSYKADHDVKGNKALASMLPLFEGKGQLYVHANKQKQIEQAIAIARKYKFKLVIVGGYDAWRVATSLNEIGAKVIYTNVFSLPQRNDDPVDQAFKVPSLLKQAGVPFALAIKADWNTRNLPFAAGQTVSHGLSKEEALKSITADAANILNLKDIGSLQKGYKASFIITEGDILDQASGKVEQLYIDGRKVDLNNRHNQLYQKYLKR